MKKVLREHLSEAVTLGQRLRIRQQSQLSNINDACGVIHTDELMYSSQQPVKSVLLLSHFTEGETETQGSWNHLLMITQLRGESQDLNPAHLGFSSLLLITCCTAFRGKSNTGIGA